MREVKYGTILGNAVRLNGFDPSVAAIPESWKVTAAFAVNDGLRKIYAEKLPILRRVEFRRYRPTWTSGETGWAVGNECWYDGAYWKLGSGNGQTAPGTTGSGWAVLEMSEVAAFVAFEQPWEGTVMDPGGVDVAAFAYEEDPKYHPEAVPVGGCKWFEDAVLLPSPAPEGVWCRFIPEAPRVTFVDWTSGESYAAGDVTYRSVTQQVYICTGAVSGTTAPEDDGTHWTAIGVADAFETYLTEVAAAAIMTDDQGRSQSTAAAEREFQAVVDRYTIGAGETTIRRGRFRR